MSKGENKVSKKTAVAVIGATVALSLVLMLILWGGPGRGFANPSGGATEPIGTPYEHWLAAAMIYAAPLEYPGALEPELYITGETALSQKAESQGVYLRLIVDGREVILHAAPLTAERQDRGTRDLYATELGFATYDEAEAELSGLQRIPVEQLQTLISQLEQVAVYSH